MAPEVKSGPTKGLLGSTYARSKRALMSTVNDIRATGAAVDVDLPTIVVAGNQSSGKSSLIEAISGINLPRAVGTCTRVPIEVRLRQDDVDWSCIVKVRREGGGQDDDGRNPEVSFGLPILEPSRVEATIRRAQLAILNPSVALEDFVTYALPEEEEDRPLGSSHQNAFSTDVIVLEITGPEMTDLTLVDLPGIIQNVGQNEDKGNIALIENMVKSYISKDCLILLVITMKGMSACDRANMTDDIQNQKAVLLAREADPEGKRTIGVLTKVDTLQGKTETDQWLKVVQNQREKLTHGYYPNPDELAEGISFARARELEAAFFRGQGPWNKLDKQLQKRLGTNNLSAFLSDKLSLFIKDKLPELEKQISNKHREIEAELKALGKEPSDDPTSALLGLLTTFEAAVAKHVEGQTDHEAFMQSVNELNEEFKEHIAHTKPGFIAIERTEASDEDAGLEGKDALEHVMDDSAARMYLDDMRLHIKGCRTRELPNQLPPAALAKLITRATSTWEELALDLLEGIRPVIQMLLDQLITDVFGKHTHGGLPGSVSTIVGEHLQLLFAKTQEQIEKLVAIERRPYTLNTHYLDRNHEKILAALKRRRAGEPLPKEDDEDHQDHVNNALASLAMIGHPGIMEDDLAKLQPPDEYETEMVLMAQTSAYWKVAFKRLIDNIPRIIDLEFLRPLADAVRNALIKELQVFGEDSQARCKDYLEEAPDRAEHRKDLKIRKLRLGDAKVAIRKFKIH